MHFLVKYKFVSLMSVLDLLVLRSLFYRGGGKCKLRLLLGPAKAHKGHLQEETILKVCTV